MRQAITASLAEFHGNDFGGGSAFGRSNSDYLAAAAAAGKGGAAFPAPRRGGRGTHGGLSAGRLAARGASSRATGGRGERRGGGAATSSWGGGEAGRLTGVGRGGAGRSGSVGVSLGGNSPRKRRRPGSPNSPLEETTVSEFTG